MTLRRLSDRCCPLHRGWLARCGGPLLGRGHSSGRGHCSLNSGWLSRHRCGLGHLRLVVLRLNRLRRSNRLLDGVGWLGSGRFRDLGLVGLDRTAGWNRLLGTTRWHGSNWRNWFLGSSGGNRSHGGNRLLGTNWLGARCGERHFRMFDQLAGLATVAAGLLTFPEKNWNVPRI